MAKQIINIIISLFCCFFISCRTNQYENLLTNADRKFWVSTDCLTSIAFDKKQKVLNIIVNRNNYGRLLPPLYNYKLEKNKIIYNEGAIRDDSTAKIVDTLTILDISKDILVLFSAKKKQVCKYTANFDGSFEDKKLKLQIYQEVLKQLVKSCEEKGQDSILVNIPLYDYGANSITENDFANINLPISFIWENQQYKFRNQKIFRIGGPTQMNRRYYGLLEYGVNLMNSMSHFIYRQYSEYKWLFVFKKRHDGKLVLCKIIKHKF